MQNKYLASSQSLKNFLSFCLLTLLLLLGLIIQDSLPSMPLLAQTPLLFVPIIFCFASLALSLPEALLFAVMTAVLTGLMAMQFPNNQPEIRLGWFILFFISWTILLQIFSALTEGVRWELHAIGSALCTATLLLGEFFLLSLKRGGFLINDRTFLLIVIPTGATLLMAPLFYGLLQFFLLPAIPTPAVKQNF